VIKTSYYFKHDSNASSDIKVKAIRRKYGWKGIGWYWYLIEALRNESDYTLPYGDLSFEGFSEDMLCKPEEVKAFIDDCLRFGLFKKASDRFCSDRLLRDMSVLDDIREKASLAGKKSAEQRRTVKKDVNASSKLTSPDFLDFTEELRPFYPHLNLDKELVLFRDYWKTRKLKDPKRALRNWLDRAGKYQNKPPRKIPQAATPYGAGVGKPLFHPDGTPI